MNNNNKNFDYEPGVKRTYTPEEAGHEKFRRPVSRQHSKRRRSINMGVLIIVLAFAVIIGVCVAVILGGRENTVSPAGPSGATDANGNVLMDEVETEPPAEIKVTVTSEQMHMGNLILVNRFYPYAFAEEEESSVVNVSDYKNDNYVVRDNGIQLRKSTVEIFNSMMDDMYAETGFNCLQINSAYRSYEEQVSTYDYYLEVNGEEYAKTYVANPGNSEHHTGLALDLNVNRDGAISYVESDEECAWFREHCDEYGFVLRYTEDKYYMTGIKGETWHYRYVGVPHASIMTEMNMCLEEYTDYIKGFTQETYVLMYDGETMSQAEYDPEYDSGYMIYYVPCTEEETEIKIPNNAEYEISGNNVDGYIVTVAK